MWAKVVFVSTIVSTILQDGYPLPTLKTTTTQPPRPVYSNHQPTNHKTDDLANRQTESIRRIVADEQKNYDKQSKDVGKKQEKSLDDLEDSFPSLEELRQKCQYFSRLFGSSQTKLPNGSNERYGNSDVTEKHDSAVAALRADYFNRPGGDVNRRPVYIRNKPTFIQKNNGGFYVTSTNKGNDVPISTKRPFWYTSTSSTPISITPAPTSTTKFASTTSTSLPISSTTETESSASSTVTSKIKIKYTRFEPVILQKTILSDGRVLYHWHKSLPTATLNLPAPITPLVPPYSAPSETIAGLPMIPAVPPVLPLSSRGVFPEPSSTTEAATTTTTERSSWLFVPFSSFFGGGQHEEESTTIESTTAPTTSTTTRSPSTSTTSKYVPVDINSEDTKLQQQLKFVVPVHYDEIDANLAAPNRPWDYNRLTYYPKGTRLQPPPILSQSFQAIKPVAPPRYSLGYTGGGYGLTYGSGVPYGAGYGNYQGYTDEKENRKLDDVEI